MTKNPKVDEDYREGIHFRYNHPPWDISVHDYPISYPFVYGCAGLIIGWLTIVGGFILILQGLLGKTGWSAKFLAPGVIFGLLGLFVLWVSRYRRPVGKRFSVSFPFAYACVGLIVGWLTILGGFVLILHGVLGKTSWSVKFLGAQSHVTDASPGVMFGLLGLFVLWITRFRGPRERL